jgi:uncharacterized protein
MRSSRREVDVPDGVASSDAWTWIPGGGGIQWARESRVIGLLESKRQSIQAICSRFGVARLEVFGSALREGFKPGESDLDLLVEFKSMEPYARVEAYFCMRDELRALLQREIDLVMVGAVKNPYILREIERTKQLMYAA